MKKKILNIVLTALLFTSILPMFGQAQENGDNSGASSINYEASGYPPYGDDDCMTGYSTIDYNYNNAYYDSHRSEGNLGFTSSIHFGRSFDNSDAFSSGVSSYQGTSTGPGPNGGYPGSPRGVYQTHYLDTSIYPNSYMRVYSR